MTNIDLPQQPEQPATDELLQQAIAHQQAGEFQQAGELYLTILQVEPNHPQANHNMGVLAVEMKQPAASLSYFITALDADPTHGQYWLNYIDALFRAGQPDDARQVLTLARQQGLQGDEVEALDARINGGAKNIAHSDSPPAPPDTKSKSEPHRSASKQNLHKGRAPSPQEINALITLFTSGRLLEALPVAQTMTERFPQHEFGWKALGAIFKQLERTSDALPPMQKAAALSPGDLEAHFNLGVTLQALGQSREAESSYRRALDINRNYVPAHINLGVVLQNSGRLAEAETSYRLALKIDPGHIKALSNLGVILQQLGRSDEAEASHRQALKLNPNNAEAHANLGNLLNEQHRDEEAERHFQQALNIDPNFADAHYNLANMLQRLGRIAEAEVHFRKTLQIKPDFANAHYNLGNLLTELDRLDDAEASFRRAIALKPNFAEASFNLGNLLSVLSRPDEAEHCFRETLETDPKYIEAYRKLGDLLIEQSRHVEAEHCFRQALEHSPNDADAHCRLGNSLFLQKRLGEAGVSYWSAIKISPDSADAYCNLGALLIEWNRYDEAEEALLHALKLDPEKPTTHFNLGNLYLRKGQLIESEIYLLRALELKPGYIDAQSTLANTLLDMGRISDAKVSYRKSLSTNPHNASVHSNLLFCLLHDETEDATNLLAEYRKFGEKFGAPLPDDHTHDNLRNPDRCLEVGFVSADFRNHAVAFFIEPILANLAGSRQISLHAYSNCKIEDSISERLRGHFKYWHPIASLSNDALAEKIRADRIDILIDLSGHSGDNRLLTFAQKPAPVQASWIGYPATTGLPSMDYYLADRFLLPEGKYDDQFTEKIVRLPANVPFLPYHDAPPVNTLPALKSGRITFGSFNRLSKLNRTSVALWAKLLRALPESRMLLAAMPEDGKYETLSGWFTQEGIALDRLIFHTRCELKDYLALHHQVDLCLDTAPYNGGTTTLHALWMGVPTLTLAGNTLPSRVGIGILGHLELQDFVAYSAEEFVRTGLSWTHNLAMLSDIRNGLRERFSKSAIGQPAMIASGLQLALRFMWQRWCAGLPPEAFEVPPQDASSPIHEAMR